jgi:acetolactate synthase-1/2/3 large subunit
MGFGIAAPIGACLASGGKRTLGLDGDGGFLMNVQELATLKYLNLPIKIFVLNNNGYGSIKNSQDNYFEGRRLGTDPKSGLGLPNIEKMVRGFELDYFQIASNSEIDEVLSRVMPIESPTIIEVIVDQNQMTEPRTTTTKLANGKLVTMPMEDLAPKLDRETLEEIMYIRLAE